MIETNTHDSEETITNSWENREGGRGNMSRDLVMLLWAVYNTRDAKEERRGGRGAWALKIWRRKKKKTGRIKRWETVGEWRPCSPRGLHYGASFSSSPMRENECEIDGMCLSDILEKINRLNINKNENQKERHAPLLALLPHTFPSSELICHGFIK